MVSQTSDWIHLTLVTIKTIVHLFASYLIISFNNTVCSENIVIYRKPNFWLGPIIRGYFWIDG